MTEPLSWEYELKAHKEGIILCGTDEAGRGPLAGRVYAAAVVLDTDTRENDIFKILNDSKALTEKRREALAPEIKKLAKSYCVAFSTAEEIDETDILSCALLAMRRAVDGLSTDRTKLSEITSEENFICCAGGKCITPDFLLVDGSVCRDFSLSAKAVVHGDAICPTIAAASVLAKTERDKYCKEVLDRAYPEYGFAAHKGYGTKAHYAAVDKYGLCLEHRRSFFKKYFERKRLED